ncbi:MAG TPA: TraC family protein [Candidatus Paceibacterota bacterium]
MIATFAGAAKSAKPTQDIVPIKEVRDGIVVLKDGGYRAILITSAVNFALKSADEQQGIVMQFQSFLNSINFPVQIFVQSRRLDIRPYVATLEAREREQTNDLMKIQIREYANFIRRFTERNSIMSKSFFVVVPYLPAVTGVPGIGRGAAGTEAERFEEHRTQLEQRVGVVQSGLSRCGVRAAQLGTEEVIELFYRLFNPGDVEQPIATAR